MVHHPGEEDPVDEGATALHLAGRMDQEVCEEDAGLQLLPTEIWIQANMNVDHLARYSCPTDNHQLHQL